LAITSMSSVGTFVLVGDGFQDGHLPAFGAVEAHKDVELLDDSVGEGESALLTTRMSAISRMPALMACMSSPAPGMLMTTVV